MGGATALIHAAREGHIDVVQVLLAAGVTTDERDERGHTALMMAAFDGHTTMVQALLAAGASTRVRSEESGLTPLIAGALSGEADVVEVLLAAGAEPEMGLESPVTRDMLMSAGARAGEHRRRARPGGRAPDGVLEGQEGGRLVEQTAVSSPKTTPSDIEVSALAVLVAEIAGSDGRDERVHLAAALKKHYRELTRGAVRSPVRDGRSAADGVGTRRNRAGSGRGA